MGSMRMAAMVLGLASGIALATGASAHSKPANGDNRAAARTPVPDPGAPDLYDQTESWSDEEGRDVQFRDWDGSPALLTLFYTSCYSHLCSAAIDLLKQVDARLSNEGDLELPFLLVSLDHDFDKPRQLMRYKQGYGMGDHWRLLVGSKQQTRSFAERLGYEYWRKDQRHIVHDYAIFLLDHDGRVVHVVDYGARASDVVERIRELGAAAVPESQPANLATDPIP